MNEQDQSNIYHNIVKCMEIHSIHLNVLFVHCVEPCMTDGNSHFRLHMELALWT